MAINYKISKDGLTIESFPKGILDLGRTTNYFDRLKRDNRIRKNAVEIVYFT